MNDNKQLKVEDIKKDAEEMRCPVQKALYYVSEFLAGPMCGRCFPCSLGTYEARIILNRITEGNGTGLDLMKLRRISEEMLIGSLCKKGKDTARFILDWMDTDVFKKHIEGVCPENQCTALFEYRIIPERCTMCGMCKDVCKYGAIQGEKKKPFLSGYLPFEIRQRKCTKCGECIKVCPEGAIIVVNTREKELTGKI
jgi:NAD-dependent dihydropyrimidine dehydrogenase PreA subunit